MPFPRRSITLAARMPAHEPAIRSAAFRNTFNNTYKRRSCPESCGQIKRYKRINHLSGNIRKAADKAEYNDIVHAFFAVLLFLFINLLPNGGNWSPLFNYNKNLRINKYRHHCYPDKLFQTSAIRDAMLCFVSKENLINQAPAFCI